LGAVEHHFAMLGGEARYAGFESDHPPLVVGVLILLVKRYPMVLAYRSGESLDRNRINQVLHDLARESPWIDQCLERLGLWDDKRFPDALILSVIDHLFPVSSEPTIPSDGLESFIDAVEARLSKRDRRLWNVFTANSLDA
jgi:hypothetical protein